VKFRKERRHPAPAASFPGYASVVAISNGAFATVYRGVELGTSRPVALKVLRLGDASEPSLEPLNEQLETLTLLSKHPNVVTLYRTFFTPEGHPVLVTELCRESLAQHLRRSGSLPATTVVPLAIKVAGALETAHLAGLVHGDVKPENILVSAVGEPLLGDFGLAALQAAAGPTEHLEGETTLHAAPEAFEEAGLSPATDVYGLASSMYQLLLGRGAFVTFPGEAPASVILRLLRDPAPRPPLGSMPIALSDLLEAALAKDPNRRPRSAASFAEALRAIEAASGWPKTAYVVWEPEELSGGPPALRAADVRGQLEAGDVDEPSEDGEDIEGGEEHGEGPDAGKAGDVGEIGDVRDPGGRREGASIWAAAPVSTGGASPPSTLIEATWHPTKADGQPAGAATPRSAPGAAEPLEGGPAGAGVAAGSQAEEVEVYEAEVDGADAAEVEREEPEGGEALSDAAMGEADASDGKPDDHSASGPAIDTKVVPGAGGMPSSEAAEDQGLAGSPVDEAIAPVTRHVVVPPAVERTVVVPEALPPRLASSSPPAHAMSHGRSTGIPRQAG
jgi:Protein kinase domain